MTRNELYILLILLKGELHGYAIHDEILREFAIEMSMTTLYRIPKYMSKKGKIIQYRDENRKIYRITQKGISLLQLEVESMENLISITKKRMK